MILIDAASKMRAHAHILSIHDHSLVVLAGAPESATSHEPHLTLVQSLAKGDKVDNIVRDATELGVSTLVVASTKRCVVQLDSERATQRMDRWRKIAEEATRQCERDDVPELLGIVSWDEAMQSVAQESARFVLYERAETPLGEPLANALIHDRPLAFAVGPEGGLDPDEVACALENGWAITSMSPTILRTETVATAVLGAVAVWRGGMQSA